MTAEFCAARSRRRGKFCRHQVAAGRTIRIIPNVDEMGSTGELRQLDFEDNRRRKPASERRFALCKAVQLGARDNQLCLSGIEFGLDLTALRTVDGVTQLCPQLFDLDFKFVGHLRLLTLVKDDRWVREAVAGSRIA